MRQRVVLLLVAFAVALFTAPSALANPPSAPGAGDPTDVANMATIAGFGDGSDVPGPHGEGLNNSPNFGPDHPSFHAVTNNPACAGHTGH